MNALTTAAPGGLSGRLVRALIALSLLAGLIGASLVATAPASEAASASCKNGRCTIYLTKADTRNLANGRVPAPPAIAPWQIKAAYYALAHGHRWFAGQYAKRGWCSAFRLSIYPWESQGYTGYRC